jgi:uncharacterized protein
VNLRRYAPIAEAMALLVITFPLAVGLHLPTLWLLAPLVLITLAKRPYATYGLGLDRPGSIGFHVAVILTVFVPYVIGHYALAHWWYGGAFHFRLPPEFLWSIPEQVLIVALPEEFFFRGYVQTQYDAVCATPYQLLGARWGAGLPIAAALFALCHIVYGGAARLVVFFPGLFYGWLRARTGTMAVPTLYHAASNLLMQIMLASLA